MIFVDLFVSTKSFNVIMDEIHKILEGEDVSSSNALWDAYYEFQEEYEKAKEAN